MALIPGAVYVFTRVEGVWTQAAKLTASDGAAYDNFGISVAVDGDTNTVVVGAPGDDGAGADSGSVYVFVKPSGGWGTSTETAKLTASDGAALDNFGYSAAVDGDTVLVGAYQDDEENDLADSGSAYIFVKPVGGWVATSTAAKLTASDGADDDWFGVSVALDGDTAVIGAPGDDDRGIDSGSAYVFVKPFGTAWTATSTAAAKLTADDGAAGDSFGYSVAVDGDTAVIGAYQDDDNGDDSGAAYVFTRNSGVWDNGVKLTADDGEAGDNFGFSVAVDVYTVVVGAYQHDPIDPDSLSYLLDAGAAYVFTWDSNGEWSQKKKLTDEDGEAGDWFGYSVAVDSAAHTALVGAGSAHVLDIHDWESVPGIEGQLPTEHTVENLFNGRVYDIQVRAVNLRSPGPQAEGEATPQVNVPPVARNDAVTTAEDTAIVIRVLGNDTDADGDTLSVTAVSTTSNGSVAITGAGTTVTYTPNANFHGSDSFTYVVSDGNGDTDTGTVDVTVTPVNDPPAATVNDPPVATNDTATTAEDTPVDIDVVANDTDVEGDTLRVSAVGTPSQGTAIIKAGSTTEVTYTPNANFHGSDSFTYVVSDGNGGTDTGTVDVTVTAVNDPPVATNDTATTAEDTAIVMRVLDNDTDVEGDTLSVTAVSTTSNGTAAITDDGTTVSYTPNANFHGSDSFTYVVSDGNGGTDTGTVNVTVTAVNDPPVATNDTASTAEDTAIDIDVVANDTDVEGDTLRVSAVGTPSQGIAIIKAGSATTVTYTPDANFHGSDSFTYVVSDGNGGTDTGTANVTIEDVGPPSQPGPPEVSSTGSTSLAVSWAAPDDQGAEITDYDMRYREAGGEFQDAGYNGIGTSATLNNLKPGTSYEVQVRAINAEGASLWSESGQGETEEAAPIPTATRTPRPEPTATRTPTPEPTATPTATPEPTPTPEPTATPTPTPKPTATPAPTPEPTATPTPTPEPTATPTPTPEPTATPAPTPEPTATPAPTPEPTATPTPTPEPTTTPTATLEPTATPALTPEPTATPTPTSEPTATPAPTPEPTATPAPTPEPTATPAPTPEPTATPTSTPEPTTTPTVPPLSTPAPTSTLSPPSTSAPIATVTPAVAPEPRASDSEGGLPWWVILLLSLGGVGVVLLAWARRRRRQG